VTPQEEQLLNSLVERVNQTQLQEKDPDAEALLNRSLGPNPDALYIMAQTVLVQNIALEQAKAQVAQLQQQAQQVRQQPAHATSFLGTLLGHRLLRRNMRSRSTCSRNTPQWPAGHRAFCAGPCRPLRVWLPGRWRLKASRPFCMASAAWGILDSDLAAQALEVPA
jgi:hypothetical protein